MKRFREYISLICALFFSILFIGLYVVVKEMVNIIIFNLIAAIIFWGIFIYEYRKDKYLQKNAKIVLGKVIKDSVKYIPIMRSFSIIEVLITYYEPETERTLLFKGRYMVTSIFEYNAIRNKDDDIFVLVGYNPCNVKQYIVYLEGLRDI